MLIKIPFAALVLVGIFHCQMILLTERLHVRRRGAPTGADDLDGMLGGGNDGGGSKINQRVGQDQRTDVLRVIECAAEHSLCAVGNGIATVCGGMTLRETDENGCWALGEDGSVEQMKFIIAPPCFGEEDSVDIIIRRVTLGDLNMGQCVSGDEIAVAEGELLGIIK